MRTLLLLLRPGRVGILQKITIKNKNRGSKEKTKLKSKDTKTYEDEENCGIFWHSVCVICGSRRNSAKILKKVDSSLRSDPSICLAIAFTDPMLPSDCSRPFFPGFLPTTTRHLDCWSLRLCVFDSTDQCPWYLPLLTSGIASLRGQSSLCGLCAKIDRQGKTFQTV